MSDFGINDMITKYLELRAYVESEESKLKEWLKPQKEGMLAIQTAIGVALQQQGLQNMKGEDGTAYLKHSDGIKVDNKQAFLQFVRDQDRFDMLDVGCLVDPVREWQARQESLPPGITSSPSVTCIIRR